MRPSTGERQVSAAPMPGGPLLHGLALRRQRQSRAPRPAETQNRSPAGAAALALALQRETGHTRGGMSSVEFRAPEPEDEAGVIEAHRIMVKEGFTFAFGFEPGDDFRLWVEQVEAWRKGEQLRPGRVPATFELALVDGEVAGRLSVRHVLNDFLLRQGGHVGYAVLPRFRRRGLGRKMLERGLQLAHAVGITRVLLTCDEDNYASRRIIEGAGGLYETSTVGAGLRVPIRRYWFG